MEAENKVYIIELVKMFKDSERKARTIQNEERRKADERYLDMCKRYALQEDKLDSIQKNLTATKQDLGEVKQLLEETQEELEGLTQRENVWRIP